MMSLSLPTVPLEVERPYLLSLLKMKGVLGRTPAGRWQLRAQTNM